MGSPAEGDQLKKITVKSAFSQDPSRCSVSPSIQIHGEPRVGPHKDPVPAPKPRRATRNPTRCSSNARRLCTPVPSPAEAALPGSQPRGRDLRPQTSSSWRALWGKAWRCASEAWGRGESIPFDRAMPPLGDSGTSTLRCRRTQAQPVVRALVPVHLRGGPRRPPPARASRARGQRPKEVRPAAPRDPLPALPSGGCGSPGRSLRPPPPTGARPTPRPRLCVRARIRTKNGPREARGTRPGRRGARGAEDAGNGGPRRRRRRGHGPGALRRERPPGFSGRPPGGREAAARATTERPAFLERPRAARCARRPPGSGLRPAGGSTAAAAPRGGGTGSEAEGPGAPPAAGREAARTEEFKKFKPLKSKCAKRIYTCI